MSAYFFFTLFRPPYRVLLSTLSLLSTNVSTDECLLLICLSVCQAVTRVQTRTRCCRWTAATVTVVTGIRGSRGHGNRATPAVSRARACRRGRWCVCRTTRTVSTTPSKTNVLSLLKSSICFLLNSL